MTHHLEPLYKMYLMEKDIAKESKRLYTIVLRQYVTYLKERGIEHAQTYDILQYREQLKDKALSINWIYTNINVIQGFYRYLRANQRRLSLPDIYLYDVAEPIKNLKGKTRVAKNVISLEQAKHLILWTKENRKYIWQYRDHAILYLMITTGLRSIEIRRAKKQDLVNRDGQWILYIQGKGRRDADEYVKVTDSVNDAIHAYLAKRKDNNPYLFINHSKASKELYLSRWFFPNMFKRLLKACGLEHTGLTPHALRHAAATFNLLRGGSLESTKQLLRHANINTTLIYAHHIERMNDDSEQQIEDFILKEEAPTLTYTNVFITLE
ncbi:MAG: tyrosine-type recombinase/integrase [Bacillota bacterium]